jgi:hypothetical protein
LTLRELGLLVTLLTACADTESVGSSTGAIAGGVVDEKDTAVLALIHGKSDLCSAALLAPNALVTARHCVSKLVAAASDGSVVCGQTKFGASEDLAKLRASFDLHIKAMGTTWHPVQEVIFLADAGFCGNDIAVVVLANAVPQAPLVPRLVDVVAAGEVYAAVGYGAVDAKGSDFGTRRRRDGLLASCAGNACEKSVALSEWMGEEGVCAGDSGGPALDGSGRVAGVVSRSLAGCGSIIYSSPSAHAVWLKNAAQRAAELGGYDAPAWAKCGSGPVCAKGYQCVATNGVESCVSVAPIEAPAPESTCAIGHASPRSGAVCGLAALLMVCRRWRACCSDRTRRRKCPRSSDRRNCR